MQRQRGGDTTTPGHEPHATSQHHDPVERGGVQELRERLEELWQGLPPDPAPEGTSLKTK